MSLVLRICIVALLMTGLAAADVHVDPDHGDDAADGRAAQPVAGGPGPVRSIARGLQLAGPGDTVHLVPRREPYRESVVIKNRRGEPGRPLVIDGHGAALTGCDPLRPEDWQDLGGGLYRSDVLYGRLNGDDTVIDRMFFVVDGRMQRMGRISKGSKAGFREPAALRPGEWTFVADTKSFYIRLTPGRDLAGSGFEVPMRKNGVAISGQDNAHLIVRNLAVSRFLNDGFNIHNRTRDVRFADITATECGDDGFSAHEDCACEVDGYTASGNSTGFTNIGESRVDLRRILLHDNLGFEIFQTSGTTFSVRDAWIRTSAEHPVAVRGNPKLGQVCNGVLENVLIQVAADQPRRIEIAPGGVLSAERLTVVGANWLVTGELRLIRSVLAAGEGRGMIEVSGVWGGSENSYAMRTFTVGGKSCAGLSAFLDAVGGAAGSRAEALDGDALRRLADPSPPLAPRGADTGAMALPKRP